MLYIASDYNPLPTSTSEGTDGEKTYETIRGITSEPEPNVSVCHGTHDKCLQNIMKATMAFARNCTQCHVVQWHGRACGPRQHFVLATVSVAVSLGAKLAQAEGKC